MNTDKILEEQLAKVGALGGGIGGGITGVLGGALGAGLAAKILPTVDFKYTVTYKGPSESAIRSAFMAIVTSEGFRKMLHPDASFDTPVFSAVLGSGALNMNPAVVCVVIEGVDEANTNIYISGSAKEGLIKQRTAEKAVMRIAEKIALHAMTGF